MRISAFLTAAAPALLTAVPAGAAVVYSESFEAGPGGFTVSTGASWEHGTPTSGPGAANSGANAWGTDLDGDYPPGQNAFLTSPVIDLSAHPGGLFQLRWWQFLQTQAGADFASVEVSANGGGNWSRVYGEASGDVSPAWEEVGVFLGPAYAVANFRVRFRLRSDATIGAAGFFVDDVTVSALEVVEVFAGDFDPDDGGFSAAGTNSTWEHGAPANGPGAAHSGSAAWATDLDGFYAAGEDSTLTSPLIDLSGSAGKPLIFSWWQALRTEAGLDVARVEVSSDGGGSWTAASPQMSGAVNEIWTRHATLLDTAFATAGFRVRFSLRANAFFQNTGFYVDTLQVFEIPGGEFSVSDFTKTGDLNEPIPFLAADFANRFTNLEGGPLTAVRIDSLPDDGDLELDGLPVTAGQEIDVADLDRLVYIPDPGFDGDDGFDWNGTSDGATYPAAAARVTLAIQPVNDPPSITAPASIDLAEDAVDVPVPGVSVSDPDAAETPGAELDVLLSAGRGTLDADLSGGAAVAAGAAGSASFTLRGTAAELNAALATLSYSPLADVNGVDTIDLTVDDRGNTGTPGSLTDDAEIAVQIDASNDPPEVTPPAPDPVAEDGRLTITGTSVDDVDAGETPGAEIDVTLTVGDGTIDLTTTAGLSFEAGADGSASMTIRGTPAEIAAALASFDYLPDPDFNGTDTLTITADDRGNTGGGPVAPVMATADIVVTPVNDAPVLTPSNPVLAGTDTTNPSPPTSVADLLGDSLTDVDDGASEGIAVIGLGGAGTWQFSVDGGGIFNPVGAVGPTSALLLRAIDQIRYLPDGVTAETATLQFRGWDQTGSSAGMHGQKLNPSPTGGSGAFSDDADTAFLSVAGQIDLALDVSANPLPFVAGGAPTTVLFTLTNLGPSTAHAVTLDAVLDLPAGVSLGAATPGAGTAFDGSEWTVPELEPGAERTLGLSLTAAPSTEDGATAGATLTVTGAAEPFSDGGGDSLSFATDLVRQVDLALTSVAAPAKVVAGSGGGNATHQLTLTNEGPSDASGATVTVVPGPPAGTTFDGATPSAGTTFAAGTWTVGDLAAGAGATLTLTYTAGPETAGGATVDSTASVQGATETLINPGNDTAAPSTPVVRRIDLRVTQTASVDPVVAGSGLGNLTVTVTLENRGPSDATGVVLGQSLVTPPGVSVDNFAPSAGTFAGGQWSAGALPAGATAQLVVTLTAGPSAPRGGTITSQAEVTASDEERVNTTDDSSVLPVAVDREANLALTVAGNTATVTAGSGPENAAFTIELSNTGPSDAGAVTVRLGATLPAAVTAGGATPTAGAYAAPDWVLDLAAGGSASLEVRYTAAANAPDGTAIALAATLVSVDGEGTGAGAPSDSDTIEITHDSALSISVSGPDVPLIAGGEPGLITVTLANAGPSDAIGEQLVNRLQLPPFAVLTGLSSDPPTGLSTTTSRNPGGSEVVNTWNLPRIAIGSSATLRVAFRVGPRAADGATVTNTAQLSDGGTPEVLALPVERRVDLSVSISESVDPVVAGSGFGNLIYHVSLLNRGPSVASGVAVDFESMLPLGADLDFVVPSTGTIDGGRWEPGSLLPGRFHILTAGITVGPETFAGTDIVSFGATASTSLEARVNTGDDSAEESTSVIVPPSLFQEWRVEHLRETDEIFSVDDPDADGLNNLLEYALGLDPMEADRGEARILSGMVRRDGAAYLTLSFVRRADDDTLVYRVQTKLVEDPAPWEDAPVQEVLSAVPHRPGLERVTCLCGEPLQPGQVQLARLRVWRAF